MNKSDKFFDFLAISSSIDNLLEILENRMGKDTMLSIEIGNVKIFAENFNNFESDGDFTMPMIIFKDKEKMLFTITIDRIIEIELDKNWLCIKLKA